jgi:membrane protease YdiL (CAAX protease family)
MKSASAKDGRPMSPGEATWWTAGLCLLAQACHWMVIHAIRTDGLTDVVNIATCEVLATSIAVWLVLRVHAPDVGLREAMGVRSMALTDFVIAVIVGVALCPPLSTLNDLVLRKWPYDAADLESFGKLVARSSRIELVLALFVVIPISQEFFFRGILFERLQRSVTPTMTVGLTALLFAYSSLELRAMPSLLILGTALSYLRSRSGSVLAPVMAQLAYWAVDGIPILRGRDPSVNVTFSAKWIGAGAFIALASLLACGLSHREKVPHE